MKRRTRFVSIDTELEIPTWEMTEQELETLKETAERIVRICSLEQQEFDRKAVREMALRIIEVMDNR